MSYGAAVPKLKDGGKLFDDRRDIPVFRGGGRDVMNLRGDSSSSKEKWGGDALHSQSSDEEAYTAEDLSPTTASHTKQSATTASMSPLATGAAGRSVKNPQMVELADSIRRKANPVPKKVLVSEKGDRYEGQASNGVANGQGIMLFACRDRYEGYFKDGLPHGKGKMSFAGGGGEAEGVWAKGKMEGMGRREWGAEGGANGWLAYQGQFKNGEINGKGTLVEGAGHVYEGDFLHGVRSGKGECRYQSGDVYIGSWLQGKKDGEGTFRWRDGYVYMGGYRNDLQHGRGLYIKPNGDKYEGTFDQGKFHGRGKYTWANGRAYEGEWFENTMHGRGVDCDLGTRYAVEYEHGALVSKEWAELDGRGAVLTPAQMHTPEDAAGISKVDGGLRQWRARRLLHNGYAERLGGAVAWNN